MIATIRPWGSRLILALSLAGTVACADKSTTLRYAPDFSAPPLTSASPVTVFPFADLRGDEGEANPYRVGGVYGGYGNRVSKVMSSSPWQQALVRALTAGLKARGIDVTAVEDRVWGIGVSMTTPLALTGEIRNFSVESRWTTTAHISGVVRLVDAEGKVLVEKAVSEREVPGMGHGVFKTEGGLEEAMNDALAGFVAKIATDPDITVRLTPQR